MSGPTLIARIIPRASKAILGKNRSKARLSMARLLDRWEDLITPEDPVVVRPVRVGWKWRGEGAEKISEGTLYITAPSAVAAKLVYQEAVIVGRVNRLFGLPANACVKRVSVTHDRTAQLLPRTRKTGKGVITEDTRATLDAVDDPVLRERLSGLAAAMAADKLA